MTWRVFSNLNYSMILLWVSATTGSMYHLVSLPASGAKPVHSEFLSHYQILQIFLHFSPEVQQSFCFPQACCVTFFPTPKPVIHQSPSSSSCSFNWGKDNRLGIIWGLVYCLSPHLFLILLFLCTVPKMRPPTSTSCQPCQRLVVKFLICFSVCWLLQP